MYWFIWKSETEIFLSVIHATNIHHMQDWARYKSGARNSVPWSPLWIAGTQPLDASPLPPRVHISRKMEQEPDLGLELGTPLRETSAPRGTSKITSNTTLNSWGIFKIRKDRKSGKKGGFFFTYSFIHSICKEKQRKMFLTTGSLSTYPN